MSMVGYVTKSDKVSRKSTHDPPDGCPIDVLLLQNQFIGESQECPRSILFPTNVKLYSNSVEPWT